jgi:hypothetical protein
LIAKEVNPKFESVTYEFETGFNEKLGYIVADVGAAVETVKHDSD